MPSPTQFDHAVRCTLPVNNFGFLNCLVMIGCVLYCAIILPNQRNLPNESVSVSGYDMADFALETAGGKILKVDKGPNNDTLMTNLLEPFCCMSRHQANVILQPQINPGECWIIKNHPTTVVIQLVNKIYPSAITIDHIPVSLSLTGKITSAPKDFSLIGLREQDDNSGTVFGDFQYNINDKPSQTFSIEKRSNETLGIVAVRFESNWGNENYTCVYRVRIHGVLENSVSYAK